MLYRKLYPVTPPFLKLQDYVFVVRNLLSENNFREKIESGIASYHRRKFAFLTSSGRAAIKILLKSLSLPEKSEIIIPAYNCIVVPDAVISAGLIPVFADVDKKTGNMSLNNIKKAKTPNTRVIILTHMFGNMSQVNQIMNWAAKENIYIIEDSCLSLGSTYNGKISGSYGHSSVFSFNIGKPITSFGGGIILTDKKSLIEKLRKMENESISKLNTVESLKLLVSVILGPMLFNPYVYFFTQSIPKIIPFFGKYQNPISTDVKDKALISKLFKIQELLILSQFKRINWIVQRRKKLYLNMTKHLNKNKAFSMFKQEENISLSPSHLSLLFNNIFLKKKFIKRALSSGIRIGEVFDYVCPLTQSYLYKGKFPGSKSIADRIVNLPFYPALTDKEAADICSEINRIISIL